MCFQNRIVRVSLGVLLKNQQVLLSKRQSNQPLEWFWEFPGGKIESNETAWQAVVRELNEEIGVQATLGYPLLCTQHLFCEPKLCLYSWLITEYQGVPYGRENQMIQWVNLFDLKKFRFPKENNSLLDCLMYQLQRSNEYAFIRYNQ